MDTTTLVTILTAIGGPTTIGILYKWAKAQGRAEALQEQSLATIKAKDAEVGELRGALKDCNDENTRLWDLLTKPEKP